MSKLSAQITSVTLALDTTRSRARRVKALWTLYTTLTYLVYVLIIALVTGPHNWALGHYAGLIGSPITIYLVREVVGAFFNWRINRQQSHLDGLQKTRDEKIADLKKATKYDSTQELLQKYGATPTKQTQARKTPQESKRKTNPSDGNQSPQQRTNFAPPPTANIVGRQAGSQNEPPRPQIESDSSRFATQQSQPNSPVSMQSVTASPAVISPDEPGFAPNAFPDVPMQRNIAYNNSPHWYDRILDVLLGEDETAAKNRLALICANCRLVNGQAPPGVRTLEELGKWRCASCGAWNGTESEGAKVVKEITRNANLDQNEDWEKVARHDELDEVNEENPSETLETSVPSNEENASGIEKSRTSGITRRVTRQAGQSKSDD